MELNILKEQVDAGLSQREIANKFSCSQGRIKHWLRKYGLKTHRGENPKKEHKCLTCGENDSDKFYIRIKQKCKSCMNKDDIIRKKQYKADAVKKMGGECSKCGYNKCLDALEFHHIDPSKKDPNFNATRYRTWESRKEELSNCILLCANCHREVHYEKRIRIGSGS